MLAIVLFAAFLIAWLSMRTVRLSGFERAAAEHLAGRWELPPNMDDRDGKKGGILFSKLSKKCSSMASERVIGPSRKRIQTREEFDNFSSIKRECFNASDDDTRAYAVNPDLDPISRAELKAWWPHGFALGLPDPESDELKESLFAAIPSARLSDSVVSENPASRHSGVIAFYYAEKSPTSNSLQAVVDAGGWAVVTEWVPSGIEHPSGRDRLGNRISSEQEDRYVLTVSDSIADPDRSIYLGSVNRRFVYWYLDSQDSGRIRVEVTDSPVRHRLSTTLERISGMRNILANEANSPNN